MIRAGIMSLALMASPAMAAQTYGLVIGIDDYAHVPDLQGAVNDALDIADALQAQDADVTLLLDGDATRANIITAWRDIAARLQEGDRLVVSYAGHGSNEPEHHAGNEVDGRDENLLLAGFSPFGAAAGERIRDDEIAELIALSPQAQIIFVADACHSGTVSRDINPVLGYRYVSHGEMTDDPLPPPPPRTLPDDGRSHVDLFLAAVDEAEKVPEFLIEGRPRGALSYAFAKGLRGEADENGNGDITKLELASFVRAQVRSISNGVQQPRIDPRGDALKVVFTVDQLRPAPARADVFASGFDSLPDVTIAALSPDVQTMLTGLSGATPVDGGAAELVVDDTLGELRTMVGDVFVDLAGQDGAQLRATLQTSVDKQRLANGLKDAARNSALQVMFAQGDQTYLAGEQITVQVGGRSTPYLALFAVASDGTMGLIYPQAGDPQSLSLGEPLDLHLQIAPPFGADHMIAFETPSPSPALIRALTLAGQENDVRALWQNLRGASATLNGQLNVAIFPFHTSPQ